MPQPASKYCVLGIDGYSCPKLPNPLICFQTWTRLILHGICNFLLKLSMIWSLMVYILLSYIFMHTWLPDYHLCSRIILTNQSNISVLDSFPCGVVVYMYIQSSLEHDHCCLFMSHKIMFQLWIGYLKSISFELANQYSCNISVPTYLSSVGFLHFLAV